MAGGRRGRAGGWGRRRGRAGSGDPTWERCAAGLPVPAGDRSRCKGEGNWALGAGPCCQKPARGGKRVAGPSCKGAASRQRRGGAAPPTSSHSAATAPHIAWDHGLGLQLTGALALGHRLRLGLPVARHGVGVRRWVPWVVLNVCAGWWALGKHAGGPGGPGCGSAGARKAAGVCVGATRGVCKFQGRQGRRLDGLAGVRDAGVPLAPMMTAFTHFAESFLACDFRRADGFTGLDRPIPFASRWAAGRGVPLADVRPRLPSRPHLHAFTQLQPATSSHASPATHNALHNTAMVASRRRRRSRLRRLHPRPMPMPVLQGLQSHEMWDKGALAPPEFV